MKKKRVFIAAVSLFLLMLCGCSSLPTKGGQAEGQQVQLYVDRAQEFEKEGKLPEARQQYELALTLDSGNQEAAAGIQRVKSTAHELAKKHYNAGMQYHQRGRLEEARREFLIVLRLEPEHQAALRALRPYTYQYGPAKRYIVHTIRSGESLSMLAKTYYGDFKQYLLIADFNNIADPKYIEIGQQIKIPEVEGLPFYADQQLVVAEREPERSLDKGPVHPSLEVKIEDPKGLLDSEHQLKAEEMTPEIDEPAEQPERTEDVAIIYRDLGLELFNKEDYQGAIVEFTKVLNLLPDDETSLDYLHRSHLQRGIRHFNKKHYDIALEEFTEVLRNSPDNETALDYVTQVYIQRGMDFFEGNNIKSAIADFTKVLTLDPHNEKALSYLSQSYFRQGLDQFKNKNYLPARENFNLALDYNSACDECREYRDKSEEIYLETHYNRGLSYYGRQQLAEAVREWESVESVNPDYRDIKEKLSKAKDLQKRLESIKMRSKD